MQMCSALGASQRPGLAHRTARQQAPRRQMAAARRTLQVCTATAEPQGEGGATPPQQPAADVCATCGVNLAQKPGGCDGNGRIMGGLAAFPGFGWWPIKAYRPCPKASEAGVRYKRKGQVLDDVLFGRKGQ